MTKKISVADLCYLNPNRSMKNGWKETITMSKTKHGYEICEQCKLWLFLLLYVPMVVWTFFYVLWDGGLRDFNLPTRLPHKWTIYEADRQYCKEILEKADEIWEKA